MGATTTGKLLESLITFVNTCISCCFMETLSKRNKKCKTCYNNIAVWKIKIIVDAKCQKQPPRYVLNIFVEVFRKLNGLLLNSRFCSFRFFQWYLLTYLIPENISLLSFLFQLPLIKVEAHLSSKKDRKLLTPNETMYVQGTLRVNKLELLQQELG